MISKRCHSCVKEYRVIDLEDSGLCSNCEQEALSKFKLPSLRDAFAILLLVALVFAILILLGGSSSWT